MEATIPRREAAKEPMNADIQIAPPHAVMAEKAVLSVLMNNTALFEEVPELSSDHFYGVGNRVIFDRMRSAVASGGGMELVSFVTGLHDSGQLEAIGGPAAISEIYTYAPNAQHFRLHLDILKEKLIRRRALELAAEVERTAREGETVEDIVSATSGPVTALHDLAAGTKPTRDTRAVLRDVMADFQALCEGKVSPMGIETSLLDINHRFRGLHGGHAIVISGYPGGGKTVLAGQFAMDAAMSEENTFIGSLEMTAEDLMKRNIAYVSRLPGDAIKDPIRYAKETWRAEKPTKAMLQQIATAVRRIDAMPLTLENLTGANVYQIIAAIRRAHRRTPLKVAVVDFVQRIRPVPELRKESKEQQLAHASNLLADLAKELEFCLILPSQLNKEGAAKHAEAINEDADLHLQIVQEKGTKEHIGIGVQKDRHHGQSGEMLSIVLDAGMLRFVPKPPPA
jgi:replicative DNA helicase